MGSRVEVRERAKKPTRHERRRPSTSKRPRKSELAEPRDGKMAQQRAKTPKKSVRLEETTARGAHTAIGGSDRIPNLRSELGGLKQTRRLAEERVGVAPPTINTQTGWGQGERPRLRLGPKIDGPRKRREREHPGPARAPCKRPSRPQPGW